MGANGKEPTCQCRRRDLGSIPGLGSSPGGGHGNPLQYSCLENPMMEESGRLQSMGSQRAGHTEATEHACTRALEASFALRSGPRS